MAVLSAAVVSSFRLALPRPPEEVWKRRLILLVAGLIVLVALVAAFHGGGSTVTATSSRAAPSTVPPAPSPPPTTTTVDPKAIQAGVAALLAHEGATPQELASAPSSPHAVAGSSHHAKVGVARTHH